jgi:hypothetical protein
VAPASLVENPLALRAPSDHGGVLFQTSDRRGSVSDLSAVLTAQQSQYPLVDSPNDARRELLDLARRWTGQYSAPESRSDQEHSSSSSQVPTPPVSLSGHQPELFHAGVWYKNFVLDEAARRSASQPVNMLIDQDLVKTNSIMVPAVVDGVLRRQRVSLDYGGVGLPFEERQVEHPDVLATVPQRVKAGAASWVSAELLDVIWPDVVELSQELRGLGYGVAAARHRLELASGCRNLEVPLSWVCQSLSFAQFVVRILDHLEAFVDQYNRCLAAYRVWYGLRENQRPMPNLVVQESWHELPFWIWTAGQPLRRRLFVKRTNDGWQLSAGQDSEVQVDQWRLDLDREFALEQLVGFADLQIRLRPRALMTTLYARGVLSQSFLHGIGGALYDQMTDRLARLVWDLQLPPYAIATATMHLANSHLTNSHWEVSTQQRLKLQRRLRDLHYSPERIPEFAQQHPQWVVDKQRLLESIPPHKQRLAWQRQVEQMLADARRVLAPEIGKTIAQLERLNIQLQERALMTHREWSFVLFDQSLPAQLRDMAQQAIESSGTPTSRPNLAP